MKLPRRKFLQQSALVTAAALTAPRLLNKLSAADSLVDPATVVPAADTPAVAVGRPMPPAPTYIAPPPGFGVIDGPFQPSF